MTLNVRTCLWFEEGGHEAAEFYVDLIPGSRIENLFAPDPQGPPLVIDFSLAGTPYQALNGGPAFPQTEAASISVTTDDQAETDRLWCALTGNGGSESKCGWLKDRWGVSWQIVPRAVLEMIAAADREAAERAMAALMQMRKLDVAEMRKAFEGE